MSSERTIAGRGHQASSAILRWLPDRRCHQGSSKSFWSVSSSPSSSIASLTYSVRAKRSQSVKCGSSLSCHPHSPLNTRFQGHQSSVSRFLTISVPSVLLRLLFTSISLSLSPPSSLYPLSPSLSYYTPTHTRPPVRTPHPTHTHVPTNPSKSIFIVLPKPTSARRLSRMKVDLSLFSLLLLLFQNNMYLIWCSFQ